MTSTIILLLAVGVFAGFIQGLTGFGSVLVALPLLALFLDMKTAAPLAGLLSVGVSGVLALRLRGQLQWPLVWPLLASALPGALLGVLALGLLPERALQVCLGVLLLAVALAGLGSGGRPTELGRLWAWLAGFSSGFLGGSMGAYGPPVVAYLAFTGWDKRVILAVMTGCFLGMGLMVALLQALGGLIGGHTLLLAGVSLPALGLGVAAGAYCFARLPSGTYRHLLMGILFVLGLTMLAKAGLA